MKVTVSSIEQAFSLIQSRYYQDKEAWELLIEWPLVVPLGEPLDLWRFAAVDKTADQKGEQRWLDERENHVENMVNNWLETNTITAAAYMMIMNLEEECNGDKQADANWMEKLDFIYTGLPHEYWSVGILKCKVTHKLNEFWKGSNWLGEKVKEKILRTRMEFAAHRGNCKDLPVTTQRGEN